MIFIMIETALMAAAILATFLFGFKLGVHTERSRRRNSPKSYQNNVLYLPKKRRGA